MKLLNWKGKFDRGSSLIQLSPYLDDKGFLRAGGRIDAAQVSENVKRPIILHKKHPVTKLLVNSYHRKCYHQGNETVVNELRQRFWIPNLRSAVKEAKSDCQYCKIVMLNQKFQKWVHCQLLD